MVDHRALNYVLWRYPERRREIDAICDDLQIRGVAEAPPELAPLGWGWGAVLCAFVDAEVSEEEDRPPDGLGPATIFEYCALIGRLDRVLRERSRAA